VERITNKLKDCLLSGINKGWSGFVWMLKILIPISFLTVLLDYSGLIYSADFFLAPAMNLLNLPTMAALPLIAGMLTGIYGGIASMVVLPLTQEQMTLIAIFLLISHGLIQEGIIQAKSGFNFLKATLSRLTASVVTVMIIARGFKAGSTTLVTTGPSHSALQPFMAVLKNWSLSTLYLSIKIFVIIMVIMVFLDIMKSFNLIDRMVKTLTPLLKLMGLDRRVGMLWLTAAVFGILYGGAVIVEEAKEKHLSKEELERLHISIGINHAVFEDPALFLSLGLSAFWLWIPRLTTAIVAVHLYNLISKIKMSEKLPKSISVPKN
jgi:Fe2+ transport system protein B